MVSRALPCEHFAPWSSSTLRIALIYGVWTQSDGDDYLRDVEVSVKGIRTVDGAQVGMTLGQIKAIYGNRLRLEVKQGHWDMYTAVVESGNKELVFGSEFGTPDGRPMVDSDEINFMFAREKSPYLL